MLDSFRGIAALTVVFHHGLVAMPAFWSVYTPKPDASKAIRLLAFTPAHLFWGGLEAVLLFFVLSGFVLAVPFERQASWYPAFAVKRICRIYIPYIVAIAIGAMLLNAMPVHSAPELSFWFNQFWNRDADFPALLDHVFMLGSRGNNYINPVIWSLVHEMRISLVFPVLMWLVGRFSWKVVLPAALLFSLSAKLGLRFVHSDNLVRSLLETASYVFLFVAGAEMSVHRVVIQSRFEAVAGWLKPLLLVGSLLLLNARWELPGKLAIPALLAAWTGAILLIAIAASYSAVGRVLEYPVFVWLGRVSYSLYLTHVIVLFTVIYLTRNAMPVQAALLISLAIALMLAEIYYRATEKTSMRLGRSLAKRLEAAHAAGSCTHY